MSRKPVATCAKAHARPTRVARSEDLPAKKRVSRLPSVTSRDCCCLYSCRSCTTCTYRNTMQLSNTQAHVNKP